jgi:hypothetical protein
VMGAIVHGGDQFYGGTVASRFLTELGPNCPNAVFGPNWVP